MSVSPPRPIARRTAPHASEEKTRPAHHGGRGHVRLPVDYIGSPYHGGLRSGDSSCGRHSPRRRGPVQKPSWPSPASRQTAGSLAALKTVLSRSGSTASAHVGVSHSACRRSGCQHRVGHSHSSLDGDSKTVRDRPPFSLHLHRMSGPSLAFCGQDLIRTHKSMGVKAKKNKGKGFFEEESLHMVCVSYHARTHTGEGDSPWRITLASSFRLCP